MLNAELVLAAVALLGCLGGGIKYVLSGIAGRQREAELRAEAERIRHELKVDTERLRWEAVMSDQISEMRREIAGQDREINYLRRVSDAYRQHVTGLEGLMRAAGMTVPSLQLPAYPAES